MFEPNPLINPLKNHRTELLGQRYSALLWATLLFTMGLGLSLWSANLKSAVPLLVGLGGASLSLLLALTVWALLRHRQQLQTSVSHTQLMHTLHSHTIVSEADKDGRITYVNDLFCHISGYSREELIGQSHSILYSGAQSDAFWRTMWQTISSGKSWRGDVCNRAKDGSLYWVDSLIAPFTDAQGQIVKYVSIRTDITATKVTQVELASERQRLQDILRGTDVGTWEWHVASGEVRFNERWAAITGHTLADLAPVSIQTWTALVHPDDLAQSNALLIAHFKGNLEYYECEMRMRHARGHWVWVLNRGKASSKSADWQVEWMAGTIMDINTRKKAEEALQASKVFLDRVGRIAGVGGWDYDLVSGRTTWSEQTCYIHEVNFDYCPSLAQALNFYALPARKLLQQAINDAVVHGQHWDLELPLLTARGRAIWVRTVGEPEYKDAQLVRIVGAFQDITERKALAENIRTQNVMMQAILAAIPLGLSVFDGNLRLVLDNTLFRTLLELPDDLFTGPGTSFESIIRFNAQRGEYGTERVEERVSHILALASKPKPHQFERQRPDGRALEVRGAPMPNGGFVTTYSDISQRKQAEMALKKTTGTLESILSSATEVAVIATDIDGVVTLFNKGAVRLLGYEAREVVGCKTAALWHDAQELQEKAKRISGQIGRTIKADELLTNEALVGKASEWCWIRKDGQRVAVSEMVNLIMDSDQEHRGYLFIGHDITAQKAHEQSMREAMQRAEMASQAKGQFLANMSHEIRTPMNAILGMLKLLQNTTLTPRQLDYASKTEGAAQSLLSLLNDILDFSKVEAGKMTLDPHPFRIDRLMRDLSVILSAYVGKKDVEVLFDIDPKVPRSLMGDSSRLQQILINLGGNAIKFTSRGEVVVAVSVAQELDAQVALRFSVRDSGIGISPENQKHIFTGFSQAEASTTRRFGGTGLGLSICKRLVELMGGTLDIDSQPGQGSTFYFTVVLPVDASQQVNDTLNNTATPLIEPLRALVVDDNVVARELMCAMVLSLGWKVDAAASGEEAVALVDKQIQSNSLPYQAFFVDWQMPGMDGWETSLKLRTQIAGKSTPIVVMVTAHGREMLTQRTHEEHALLNGFLVKPVTASMLLDAVVEAKAAMLYPQRPESAPHSQPKRLQGLRLLVVEDNAINQQIAQELLSAEGATVQLANNGQLGVEAVLAAAPLFDAVLMDVQMPVMDGYTATRTLRRALGNTPLPIIAMTANAMMSDQEACREAGMNDHIGKPFDLTHLVATVLRHVGRANAPMHLNAPAPKPELLQEPVNPPEQSPVLCEGIDVEGAIKRMGCDESFYLEILQMFLHDSEPMPRELKRHLQQGDHAGTARLLHTLKGLAATVGAEELTHVAAQAEEQSKNHPQEVVAETLINTIGDSINKTVNLLQEVIQKLDKSTPPAPAPTLPPQTGVAPFTPAPVQMDNATLLVMLNRLDRLLRDSDLDAITVHTHLSRDRDSALDETFSALDRAMTALDFATARRHCQTLTQHLTSPNAL